MLGKVGDVHGHGTRAAGSGLFLATRDHRSVGYRVPKEWATMTEAQRGVGSLAGLKRGSRGGFLAGYASVGCRVRGCYVCRGGGVEGSQRGTEAGAEAGVRDVEVNAG